MSAPVKPGTAEWGQWATLFAHVTIATRDLRNRPLFSGRQQMTRTLWDMGYRPTDEQVVAERERQRTKFATAADQTDDEGA